MNLRDVAQAVKRGVIAARGLPLDHGAGNVTEAQAAQMDSKLDCLDLALKLAVEELGGVRRGTPVLGTSSAHGFPGFWNLDTSLAKEFHSSERRYFEFRWEAFNALNHQNLGSPNTGFWLPPKADGSSDRVHQAGCSFGRITNIQTDPRSMEFALKFYR